MSACKPHLADKETQDPSHHSLDPSKKQPDRDLHANGHEEQAHEQALVGRNITLHLQSKLCLCNQQARLRTPVQLQPSHIALADGRPFQETSSMTQAA